MRPLFHHVASAGSTEFFVAACLLVVIGTGVLTAASGLSMGLGAFIAGLLLAETEYRREIEVTIEPFKGLLLGLFFVAVGAGLDLSRLILNPGTTLGLALCVIAVKAAITYGSARMLGLPWRVALESSLMLAPGGEFAFVLIGAAVESHVVAEATAVDANIAVTLSLFAVPALATLSRRLVRKMPSADAHLAEVPPVADAAPRALLIGYGRVGQLVGDMMRKHGIAYLAVDENVATVREFRRQGIDIAWGNAGRIELLERCGLASASALVITLDAADTAEEIVRLVRARRPDLTIVARARDAERAARLYALGVTDAVPETIEASLQLSEAVLADMGIAMGLVIASIHERREDFRKMLQPVTAKAKAKRAVLVSSRVKEMAKRTEAANRRSVGTIEP
jgi:CPA2 family monovalent cation:H+ antiporter-2